MKTAMYLLIVGTVISGLAAYAASGQRAPQVAPPAMAATGN